MIKRTYLLCFVLICVFAFDAMAVTYTFESDGQWSDSENWDIYPGTVVPTGDTVIIDAFCAIATGVEVSVEDKLVVNADASLIVDGKLEVLGTADFNSEVEINGELVSDGDVFVNDTLVNNGLVIVSDFLYVDDFFMNNDSIIVELGAEFQNGSFLVNATTGTIKSSGLVRSFISFDNQGKTMISGDFQVPNILGNTVNNSDSLVIMNMGRVEADFNNDGVVEVASGANFVIADGSVFNNNSTLNCKGRTDISDNSGFENVGTLHIFTGGVVNYLNTIPSTLSTF